MTSPIESALNMNENKEWNRLEKGQENPIYNLTSWGGKIAAYSSFRVGPYG